MVPSHRKACMLFLAVLFFFQNVAYAQEARLSEIIVTNAGNDLRIFLSVEGAFTEEMKTAVLSGVTTTFSFFITMYKVRNFWIDKKIADVTVTHTIKYHNLKKKFIITRSWENNKPQVVGSFSEARQLMSKIESLKIVSLSELRKGRQYQLRAKAELSKLTLPLYLHYILFFVSLWDFETDWYTIDFVY